MPYIWNNEKGRKSSAKRVSDARFRGKDANVGFRIAGITIVDVLPRGENTLNSAQYRVKYDNCPHTNIITHSALSKRARASTITAKCAKCVQIERGGTIRSRGNRSQTEPITGRIDCGAMMPAPSPAAMAGWWPL